MFIVKLPLNQSELGQKGPGPITLFGLFHCSYFIKGHFSQCSLKEKGRPPRPKPFHLSDENSTEYLFTRLFLYQNRKYVQISLFLSNACLKYNAVNTRNKRNIRGVQRIQHMLLPMLEMFLI